MAKHIEHKAGEHPAPKPDELNAPPEGPPDDMPLPGSETVAPPPPAAVAPVVSPPQPVAGSPGPALTTTVPPSPTWYAYQCPNYPQLPPRFAHDPDEQVSADEHGAIVMCKHCKQWHRAVGVTFAPPPATARRVV